jgi:hypothetical protein
MALDQGVHVGITVYRLGLVHMHLDQYLQVWTNVYTLGLVSARRDNQFIQTNIHRSSFPCLAIQYTIALSHSQSTTMAYYVHFVSS